MLTTLSIISRSQGQIHGAKPSLEEIERQLEADPMTHAVSRCAGMVAALVERLRGVKAAALARPGAAELRERALANIPRI